MKKILLIITTVGAVICACQKEPDQLRFNVTINKIGYGTVVADKTSNIAPGSSITITVTPNKANSLYSLVINNSPVTLTPTDKEFRYTILIVNSNQVVDVSFTNTANILISTIQSKLPWKLKALKFFRNDGTLLYSIVLTQEKIDENKYFYFNYPNTNYVEELTSDGFRLLYTNWEIFTNLLTVNSMSNIILELTSSKLVYNAPVGAYPAMSSTTFAQYTYERN